MLSGVSAVVRPQSVVKQLDFPRTTADTPLSIMPSSALWLFLLLADRGLLKQMLSLDRTEPISVIFCQREGACYPCSATLQLSQEHGRRTLERILGLKRLL